MDNTRELLKKAKSEVRLKTLGFYSLLVSEVNEQGKIMLGRLELVTRYGLSFTELKRLRDELIQTNLITYSKGNRFSKSIYQINGWQAINDAMETQELVKEREDIAQIQETDEDSNQQHQVVDEQIEVDEEDDESVPNEYG